jgi:16S rRNA processing protein RimM
MDKLKIGTIANSFGIKGECKVKSFTDFNDERFAKGAKVYLDFEGLKEMTIQSSKEHKGMLLVHFEGYPSINDIEKFKGCNIYVDAKDLHQLAEGEFYFFELKGMGVINELGDSLGTVLQVEDGMAHNYLRVEKLDKTTALIPYTPAFILRVDKAKKLIQIRVIEGLL